VLPLVTADDKPWPVVIYSRVAPDYERVTQPDDRPTKEYYTIASGGRADGTIWDETQSKADFPEIAGSIAQELAKQNHSFAQGIEDAVLLIAIYWERTDPHDPAEIPQRRGYLPRSATGDRRSAQPAVSRFSKPR